MAAPTENETWLVEHGGNIVEKWAQTGDAGLNAWERLVYCLWIADCMMRNAGDFASAADLCPGFQSDAKDLSRKLSLSLTWEAFSLPQAQLQREYFGRFEAMCHEIRQIARYTNDS